MRLHQLLLLALCLMLIANCGDDSKRNVVDFKANSVIEVDPATADDYYASSIFSKFEVVPLFGGPYFDPEGVTDVHTSDSLIILADRYPPSCLHLYSAQGEFQRSFCKQGDGPDTYSSIWDFEYDSKTGLINILDRTNMSINTYSLDGKLTSKIKHGMYGASMAPNGKGGFYVYCINEKNANTKKVAEINAEGKIINEFIEIDRHKGGFLNFSSLSNFSVNQESILFQEKFDPIIYRMLQSGTAEKYKYISFGNYSFPSSDLEKEYEDVREFMEYVNYTDYAHSVDSYFEVEDKTVFSFVFRNDSYLALVDNSTESVRVIRRVHDDLVTNTWALEKFNWIGPLNVSKLGELIFLIDERAITTEDQEKITKQPFYSEASRSLLDQVEGWKKNYRLSIVRAKLN